MKFSNGPEEPHDVSISDYCWHMFFNKKKEKKKSTWKTFDRWFVPWHFFQKSFFRLVRFPQKSIFFWDHKGTSAPIFKRASCRICGWSKFTNQEERGYFPSWDCTCVWKISRHDCYSRRNNVNFFCIKFHFVWDWWVVNGRYSWGRRNARRTWNNEPCT